MKASKKPTAAVAKKPSKRLIGKKSMANAMPKKDLGELADMIDDVVPAEFRGTDRFLDIVTWNIRFFNPRDPARVANIVKVLSALNADVLVLQEIEDESLAPVIEGLRKSGAGLYKAAYGTTGGDQRVAFLYDTVWLRAKDDIRELASKGEVIAAGKDAFPRLPLWSYFTGLPVNENNEAFDFQLVGVHLKSQRGDGVTDQAQREIAANWLAEWLTENSSNIDGDVLILGDWNQPPSAPAWKVFRDLEQAGSVEFTSINDEDEISHLMYRSRTDIGSRLDLKVFTASAAAQQAEGGGGAVVRWTSLSELLDSGSSATQIKSLLREISRDLSDHMPVVSRFYFKPRQG